MKRVKMEVSELLGLSRSLAYKHLRWVVLSFSLTSLISCYGSAGKPVGSGVGGSGTGDITSASDVATMRNLPSRFMIDLPRSLAGEQAVGTSANAVNIKMQKSHALLGQEPAQAASFQRFQFSKKLIDEYSSSAAKYYYFADLLMDQVRAKCPSQTSCSLMQGEVSVKVTTAMAKKIIQLGRLRGNGAQEVSSLAGSQIPLPEVRYIRIVSGEGYDHRLTLVINESSNVDLLWNEDRTRVRAVFRDSIGNEKLGFEIYARIFQYDDTEQRSDLTIIKGTRTKLSMSLQKLADEGDGLVKAAFGWNAFINGSLDYSFASGLAGDAGGFFQSMLPGSSSDAQESFDAAGYLTGENNPYQTKFLSGLQKYRFPTILIASEGAQQGGGGQSVGQKGSSLAVVSLGSASGSGSGGSSADYLVVPGTSGALVPETLSNVIGSVFFLSADQSSGRVLFWGDLSQIASARVFKNTGSTYDFQSGLSLSLGN